jgi:hypothetical protein
MLKFTSLILKVGLRRESLRRLEGFDAPADGVFAPSRIEAECPEKRNDQEIVSSLGGASNTDVKWWLFVGLEQTLQCTPLASRVPGQKQTTRYSPGRRTAK